MTAPALGAVRGRERRVLVVGESWVKHTVHMKGFDQFHSTEYEEGGGDFLAALESAGHSVTYVRAHEVSQRFPLTMEELAAFDVIVISDIGANSFLLTDDVFLRSEPSVNRLRLIADYVRGGGGLLMIGGYLSFAGIDGRARYGASPLAEVLPVQVLDHDDRVEVPEGVSARVLAPEHPAISGVSEIWPVLLGYNRLVPKPDASVLVAVGDDPLIAVSDVGEGRSVAFASDCAPHWAPPAFVNWSDYTRLWASIVNWVAGSDSKPATSTDATLSNAPAS